MPAKPLTPLAATMALYKKKPKPPPYGGPTVENLQKKMHQYAKNPKTQQGPPVPKRGKRRRPDYTDPNNWNRNRPYG